MPRRPRSSAAPTATATARAEGAGERAPRGAWNENVARTRSSAWPRSGASPSQRPRCARGAAAFALELWRPTKRSSRASRPCALVAREPRLDGRARAGYDPQGREEEGQDLDRRRRRRASRSRARRRSSARRRTRKPPMELRVAVMQARDLPVMDKALFGGGGSSAGRAPHLRRRAVRDRGAQEVALPGVELRRAASPIRGGRGSSRACASSSRTGTSRRERLHGQRLGRPLARDKEVRRAWFPLYSELAETAVQGATGSWRRSPPSPCSARPTRRRASSPTARTLTRRADGGAGEEVVRARGAPQAERRRRPMARARRPLRRARAARDAVRRRARRRRKRRPRAIRRPRRPRRRHRAIGDDVVGTFGEIELARQWRHNPARHVLRGRGRRAPGARRRTGSRSR